MKRNLRRSLALLGVMFLGIGAKQIFDQIPLTLAGVSGDGVVIGLTENRDFGQHRHSASPRVEFTVNNKRYVVNSNVYTNWARMRIGDKVPVVFDPRDPSRSTIDTFTDRWCFGIIFGAIGTGAIIACVFSRSASSNSVAN